MNAPDNLAHVDAQRAQAWGAGFRPVPVMSHNASGPSPGKRPLGKDWITRARQNPPACLAYPVAEHAKNTGILCDGLRAIDVDVDDPELVRAIRAEIKSRFGEAPVRLRDNSARVLILLRAAEGEPPKRVCAGTAGKVEVLGHGQQFVAFGTHASGAKLAWENGAPGQIRRDELPAATEAQISDLFAAIASIIGADVKPSAEWEQRNEHSGEDAVDLFDVAAALAVIPNDGPADWEWWNNVAMAVWAATGGSEAGFHALDAWSRRNPAYDLKETRDRWDHYKTSPPNRTGAGKLFSMAREAVPGWEPTSTAKRTAAPSAPDMSILRLNRRPPPPLPLDVFGPFWRTFIENAAKAAACPVDYVAAPLLSSASCLIGNARWAQATPGWTEPPHLWTCDVGDSGGGKSPGADVLFRDVLPEIEKRMASDFPDRHAEWKRDAEAHKARMEQWAADVRAAQNPKEGKGAPPPLPPGEPPVEPQAPRLRLNDVTIEKTAALLATAAPKGLLIVRDELPGFLLGMSNYNDTGRQFWLEAYGGRPYRVERQKNPLPIVVERLAVAMFGGAQPAKLAELMREPDDGLMARICWFWPDPVPFDLSEAAPGAVEAVNALDRLRQLELAPGAAPGDPARPFMVPMTAEARGLIRDFGRAMQARQAEAGGLMVSTIGKARGLALRLALVLEFLWWAGESGYAAPPTEISARATGAACLLVDEYLLPMAERVFGDAATPPEDRNAATLARWIFKTRPETVNTRQLQRDVRLPGLDTAEVIRATCAALVEAGWLIEPPRSGGAGRPTGTYGVNPAIWQGGA